MKKETRLIGIRHTQNYHDQAQRILSDLRTATERARDDLDHIGDEIETNPCTYYYGDRKIFQRQTAHETAEIRAIKKIKQHVINAITMSNLLIAQTRQNITSEVKSANDTVSAIETDIDIAKTITLHSGEKNG